MSRDNNLYDEDEGARPSSLHPVHKLSTPDPLYDQQLLRELAIINERTRKELGPLPPRGVPVGPRRNTDLRSTSKQPDVPLVARIGAATHSSAASSAGLHQPEENDIVKPQYLAMAAALSMGTVGAHPGTNASEPALNGAESDLRASKPTWPDIGVAERALGDGDQAWPEAMFVEYAKGRWIAWVLMSPVHGQSKALDFFSGHVEDVTLMNPGEYNDSFVDSHGVTHKSVVHPSFYYKDPRPGGVIGSHVQINATWLRFDKGLRCKPDLNISQRTSSDLKAVIWRKAILYPGSGNSGCPDGVWDSLIGTGLELRDGTMLIAAGRYVFRVRQDDLSPVGSAPHLHVVDEVDVLRVIEEATGKDIDNASVYLAEKLHLD